MSPERFRLLAAVLVVLALVSIGQVRAQACPDLDLDGYANCTLAGCNSSRLLCGDYNDADNQVFPGHAGTCNQKDDTCNGVVDDGSPKRTAQRKLGDSTAAGGDNFATNITVVGDTNADGISEYVVGADLDDGSAQSDRGSALLFDGKSRTLICRATDPTGSTSDRLGVGLAAVGDQNGDGTVDFTAAAYLDDTPQGVDAGSVLIFSGSNCVFIRRLSDTGGATSDQLGLSVAVIGDLTGDGTQEIAVGSPLDDTALGTDAGSVVIFNGATGSVLRKLTDTASAASDRLGFEIVGLSDPNGDGTSDLLAGVHLDDTPGGVDFGSLVLFSGGDGAVIARFSDGQGRSSDNQGISVAAADLDGDRAVEFLSGAYLADTADGSDAGALLIFSRESNCDGDTFVPWSGDCNDANSATKTGANETCDSIDNSCDGSVDNDADADGAAACTDCNNADPRICPGAPKRCNGVDDNCNVSIDEGADADGDGVTTPCDCNDSNNAIKPGAAEVCNHSDDDCDGAIDEGSTLTVRFMRTVATSHGSAQNTQPALPRAVYPPASVEDSPRSSAVHLA